VQQDVEAIEQRAVVVATRNSFSEWVDRVRYDFEIMLEGSKAECRVGESMAYSVERCRRDRDAQEVRKVVSSLQTYRVSAVPLNRVQIF
jgi:hypothetical protein